MLLLPLGLTTVAAHVQQQRHLVKVRRLTCEKKKPPRGVKVFNNDTVFVGEQFAAVSQSLVIGRQQHIVTHVRAKAIRAPTTTMKSRMFHMSRK